MQEPTFSILFPASTHQAIEERYSSAQARLRLVGAEGAPVVEYRPGEPASSVASRLATEAVVVVTDPTMLTGPGLAPKLIALLTATGAAAVVPTSAESPEPAQRAGPFENYLVLGQFDEQCARIENSDRPESEPFRWTAEDPGIYATRSESLRGSERTLSTLLDGALVVIARRLYVHRFAAMRGQPRLDLLERVPTSASAILEFGCGEGALAAALKARQPCRVVGVELDPEASRIAATRLDRLVSGDARDLLSTIGETFDFAIGGDIVEHLDDPWDFLARLRRVMKPDGRLLLSLPNLACWAVTRELMQGRFDYVYMGITCVGHLRFFTRRSIEEMLQISGWKRISIEPQPEFRTSEYQEYAELLHGSGSEISEADILAPGYYVIAEATNV